jgi:hypothetical protein
MTSQKTPSASAVTTRRTANQLSGDESCICGGVQDPIRFVFLDRVEAKCNGGGGAERCEHFDKAGP